MATDNFDYCNYCACKETLSFYKQRGKIVSVSQSSVMMGWTAIIVDDEEIIWLTNVPDKCECKSNPQED